MRLTKQTSNILEIIWNTPHGYGTHHATTEHKYKISRWIMCQPYLYPEEHSNLWHQNSSFQHLIDLATLILLSNDIDPYELAFVCHTTIQ